MRRQMLLPLLLPFFLLVVLSREGIIDAHPNTACPVSSISVSLASNPQPPTGEPIPIPLGMTKQFTATGKCSDGEIMDATRLVTWSGPDFLKLKMRGISGL